MRKFLIIIFLVLSLSLFAVDFSLGVGGGVSGTMHNGNPWVAPGPNISLEFDIHKGFGIGGTADFSFKGSNDNLFLTYGDIFYKVPVGPIEKNFYTKIALSGGGIVDNTIDKNDTRHLVFGWGIDAVGKLTDNINLKGFFRAFRVENCMSTALFQTLVAGVQFEFSF